METVFYGCGCFITSSMHGDREIMYVHACFKHSLESSVHEAQRALSDITGGVEAPSNWQAEEVQAALVALAMAIRGQQEVGVV